MRLVGTGFLSAEGLARAEKIQHQIAPLLLIVQRTIALCHDGLQSVTIDRQESDIEKQKVIACVVLARLLETSESMVLLAKGGFSVDVTSGLRNFLDAYFIFGNVCNDPAFVPEYFSSDLKIRQKLLNQAAKHKSELFELVNQYATQKVLDDLKAHIEHVDALDFDSYRYANKVGCAHLYDSLYRIASAATHSTPRSLEAYVSENADGEVVELHRHPELGNIPERLLDLGCFLLNVRTAFDELFGTDASNDIRQLRVALDKVSVVE